MGSNQLTFGSHLCVSFTGKYFTDIKDIMNLTEIGYTINLTPYITTSFLSGELHVQATARLKEFINGHSERGFSLDIGYRTKF